MKKIKEKQKSDKPEKTRHVLRYVENIWKPNHLATLLSKLPGTNEAARAGDGITFWWSGNSGKSQPRPGSRIFFRTLIVPHRLWMLQAEEDTHTPATERKGIRWRSWFGAGDGFAKAKFYCFRKEKVRAKEFARPELLVSGVFFATVKGMRKDCIKKVLFW